MVVVVTESLQPWRLCRTEERMRHFLALGVLTAYFGLSHVARADETPSGFSLGVRAAYAAPMGEAETGTDLDKSISGGVPLWLDVGYRVSPHVYLGAFFIYEFGFVGADCKSINVSCAVHDITFGANVQFHIKPGARFDPWVGVGAGYEVLGFNASYNGERASATVSGIQLLNVQLGGDFRPSSSFAVGPFLSLSLGRYGSTSETDAHGRQSDTSIESPAIHEWLLIGVRGQYVL
jgi:hypothetical protein